MVLKVMFTSLCPCCGDEISAVTIDGWCRADLYVENLLMLH